MKCDFVLNNSTLRRKTQRNRRHSVCLFVCFYSIFFKPVTSEPRIVCEWTSLLTSCTITPPDVSRIISVTSLCLWSRYILFIWCERFLKHRESDFYIKSLRAEWWCTNTYCRTDTRLSTVNHVLLYHHHRVWSDIDIDEMVLKSSDNPVKKKPWTPDLRSTRSDVGTGSSKCRFPQSSIRG